MQVAFINHGKCSGYNCNTIVALWAELDVKIGGWEVPDDEWEDPMYSFVGHWETNADTMCASCIARGNSNPIFVDLVEDAQTAQVISTMPRAGITGYFFDLKDVNGAVYSQCTVMCTGDTSTYLHGMGINESLREHAIKQQSKRG